MKVLITSENPVKLNACLQAFNQVFSNQNITYEALKVESEVPHQPLSDTETLQGAKNRVKNARRTGKSFDYIVGIEGGAELTGDKGFSFAWVVVESEDKSGQARTAAFEIPPKAVAMLEEGYELGIANDELFELHNSKQKNGAIGILTNNLVTRTGLYAPAVIMALLPFMEHNLTLFKPV